MNEELGAIFAVFGAVALFILIIWLIVLAYLVVVYILSSIATYKISKSRGYKNAWLAWVPVANSYVLGSIADSIDGYNGKRSYYRHLLLWGSLLPVVVNTIISIVGFSMGFASEFATEEALGGAVAMSLPVMIPLYILAMAIPFAVMIISYIVHYKIYADYAPKSATTYLVLSIFFNFLPPFFLFSLRNKPSVSLSRAQGTPIIR